jgi:hypothetical protein
MIRRNTWITLAIFLVLLGFAYWWTRMRPEGAISADATPTQTALWEVEADQIVGIRVEYLTTGETVELQLQDDGTWTVLQPEEASITPERAQQAVDWLAAPRPRTTLPDPGDLLNFGLAEPVDRVTITLRDGSTHVFEVGAETPTGTTQYVRLSGQTEVLVVSKYSLDAVLGLLADVVPTPTPTATATAEGATATAPAPTETPAPSATSGGPGTPGP